MVLLIEYPFSVKDAKAKYISDIIIKKHACCTAKSSVISCEEFKDFFLNKIDYIRSNILLSSKDFSLVIKEPPAFNHFHPVFLPLLGCIIAGMKPTSCQFDIIPTKLPKQSFEVQLVLLY